MVDKNRKMLSKDEVCELAKKVSDWKGLPNSEEYFGEVEDLCVSMDYDVERADGNPKRIDISVKVGSSLYSTRSQIGVCNTSDEEFIQFYNDVRRKYQESINSKREELRRDGLDMARKALAE